MAQSGRRRIRPNVESQTSSNIELLDIILRSLGHQLKPSNDAQWIQVDGGEGGGGGGGQPEPK